MGKMRTKFSKKSKYYISRHAFLTVYHHCMMYPDWVREYTEMVGLRGVKQDSGGGGIGDPTASQAMRLKDLSDRIELIRQTAFDAEPLLYPYLLDGVTDDEMTFDRLKAKGMPCERDMYYDRRRRFYWMMSRKLNL